MFTWKALRHCSDASFWDFLQVTVASGAAAVEREAARPVLSRLSSLEVCRCEVSCVWHKKNKRHDETCTLPNTSPRAKWNEHLKTLPFSRDRWLHIKNTLSAWYAPSAPPPARMCEHESSYPFALASSCFNFDFGPILTQTETRFLYSVWFIINE